MTEEFLEEVTIDNILIDFGENFNFGNEINTSKVLALFQLYKAYGLDDDLAQDAVYYFIDSYADILGWNISE